MSIVGKYLYGWETLEPILMGTLAQEMNIMLLGSHGCGKSLFAKFVSKAMGNENKFIKYEMSKENLLSMVGCPSPEDLRKGKITYATHDRSIFNADVVMMDELTRAGRENQNMVLEILEERTVFGIPLKYKFAIATANEETYRGAYKLDAALLDRFYAVLPVPSLESRDNFISAEEVGKMIELNQGKREQELEESNKSVKEAIDKIKETYKELWANEKIRVNVNEFAAKFFSAFVGSIKQFNAGAGKDNKVKVSFRQIATQAVPLIFAVSAYYKAMKDEVEFLQYGAWDAIKYSIGTKLGYPVDKLRPIFENLKDLLIDGDTLITRIMVSLTGGSLKERVSALEKYIIPIKEKMQHAEKVHVVGTMLNDASNSSEDILQLIKLLEVLEREKVNEETEYTTKLRLFGLASGEHLGKVASFFGNFDAEKDIV